MSRPKKLPADKASHVLRVPLTPAEIEFLRADAGQTPLAAYVRSHLFGSTESPEPANQQLFSEIEQRLKERNLLTQKAPFFHFNELRKLLS